MLPALQLNIEKVIGRSLTSSECDDFSALLFEKSFDKKSVLVEEGSVCRYIYYITEGSCYSYIRDEKGEHHAVQFALDGYWISDLFSFYSKRQAIFSIEALEPSRALLLNIDNFQKACETIPFVDRYFRILIQKAYVSLQYRIAKTNSVSAEERYLEFSQLHPDFVQRIPQFLIASYLGIQPQSLSRIRKEMSHKR